MNISPHEQLAAEHILEGAVPLSSLSPEARRTAGQMQATIHALRAWRRHFDQLPVPVVPEKPPGRVRPIRWWRLSWAAAALLVLALTVISVTSWRRDSGSRLSESPTAAEQLAWITLVVPARDDAVPDSRRGHKTTKRGGYGGTSAAGNPTVEPPKIGRPSGAGPIAPSLGTVRPPPSDPSSFSICRTGNLTFRIPGTLPGGFHFADGRSVSPGRLALTYREDHGRVRVFLTAAKGPETPFTLTQIGNRSIVAGIRGPLAIGFEATEVVNQDWSSIAQLFVEN